MRRCGKHDCAEHVFRAAAQAPFLSSPEQAGRKRDPLFDDQRARSLHSADFVRAERVKIDRAVEINGDFTVRLHTVAHKKTARIFFFYALCKRVDIVDRTRFIVDVHDGNERRLVVDERDQRFGVHRAVAPERREPNVAPRRFQRFETFVYRGVFALVRDDVPALRRRENRRIIRLCSARGKHKRVSESVANKTQQGFARVFERNRNVVRARIARRGIIKAFFKIAFGAFQRRMKERRRRRMIEINHCLSNLFLPAARTRYSSIISRVSMI